MSFLSIASIRHGFKIIDTITMSAIARHTRSLATYVRHVMVSLKHENGAAVCTLYGRDISKAENMGPMIAFNLKRSDGTWFGYREVEKVASLSGIHLRAVSVILVHVLNIFVYLIPICYPILRQGMFAGMIMT